AATATYGSRFGDNADWYVSGSYQHIGSRITQPGDQEPLVGLHSDMIFFDPVTGNNGAGAVFDWTPFLKLPSYDLVNLSAGVEFDNGLDAVLYVNNVFDESPKLAFDRERGGRARLGYHVGQPRTIGLTLRKAFGR
ncbi:MAG TPA: TonB-dependent receptor, partial [Sphingomicrobium sp.]|nr:TonB-dependent receptor [Sphingomicrobium sp.]